MDLPMHERLRNEQWRRTIQGATGRDLENLKTVALAILQYAETNRSFALQQAAAFLPKQQETPAAEAAGASTL